MKKVAEGIYVNKLKNGLNYYVRYNVEGKDNNINVTKLHNITTITKAKLKLGELKSKAQEKKYLKPIDEKIDVLVDKYFATVKRTDRALENTYAHTARNPYDKYCKDVIGHLKLSSLRDHDFDKIKALLDKAEVGSATFTRIKQVLKSALRHHLKRDFIPSTFKPNKQAQLKTRSYPITQIIREPLEQAVKKMYKSIMALPIEERAPLLLNFLVARRLGEVLLYKWEDVDLKRGIVTSTQTKNGKIDTVMLPVEVIKDLTALRKGRKSTDLMFTIAKPVLQRRYKNMLKSLDINKKLLYGASTHKSRHLLASILLSKKIVSLEVVQAILSHTHKDVISHYISVSDADKRKALEVYWTIVRA